MKFPQGSPSMGETGGYWDMFINGDDSFHNVINMLDFPLESVGEDKCVIAENREAQFQSLGPFTLEISQGFAPVFRSDIAEVKPINFVQNDAASDRKQLPVVTEISSTHVPLDSSHPKNPSLFQTPSPNHVLESSSSCSAGKNLSTSHELQVPVRARTKIPRSSTFSRWHLLSPLNSPKIISNSVPDESELKEDSYHQHIPSKRCTHCQAVKTPQWRKGPMGLKTLCNACGVRYQSGRLVPEYRPAASPTFVPSLHSNLHKKVIRMRGMREKHIPEIIETDPAMSVHQNLFP